MKEMAYVFYMYLVDLMKLWIVFWGIIGFALNKKKKIYLMLGMFQCSVLMISGLIYKQSPDLVSMIILGTVVFSVCFLFQGKFIKKLALSLLVYIIVLFLDGCVIGFASLMTNSSGRDMIEDFKFRELCNVFNVFTLGVIAIWNRYQKKATHILHISRRIYILLFTGAGSGTLIIAGLMVRTVSGSSDSVRKLTLAVTIIIILSFFVACMMMIFVIESRDSFKALSLINQSVIESQQQYYLMVHEKQQEMRSIRHEMKNHLACISGLYKSKKMEELERYVNQLTEEAENSDVLFDVGNDIVNAILNDAQTRYRNENIRFRIQGGFPFENAIAPLDLCVIFANIVSNAVEAIQRMERDRDVIDYIDIKISSYKEDLFIDMKNPIGNSVSVQNGTIITSKQDKTRHGFGVKNVVQRVEKYHGTVRFHNENNEFFVEIQMKMKV